MLDQFPWLVACGRLLCPIYRFKWPQMQWWNHVGFNRYLNHFDELQGMNSDRRWNLFQLMRLTKNVPGDTAECGCYKGAGSYLMCLFHAGNRKVTRQHHIFDSFEGVSKPLEIDGTHWTEHDLSATESEVQTALMEFKGLYQIYQGWIPQRFDEVASKKFSFVHIDVDLYQPTKDSIAFFYSRLNLGGILLCDDYGFTSCPGATYAVDEFLADKPEKMITLASGGGFFIKGTAVSCVEPRRTVSGENFE